MYRLGAVHFKLSMILSALRHAEKGTLTGKIVCDDTDFMIAGKMINVYYINALKFLEAMPGESDKIRNRREKVLFESLPATFTTGEAKEIAAEKSICSPRTVDNFLIRYQQSGLIEPTEKYGTYQKVKTE